MTDISVDGDERVVRIYTDIGVKKSRIITFRHIQTDRQNRTMGVHPQFRRQNLLLKTLKKDYRSMGKDLKIATTGAHKKNTKRMKADLERALLLRMKTLKDCEGGETMMEQLEGLLQNDNRKMLMLKKRVNESMGQMKERQTQSELRLVRTENALETANLRFNAVQHENQLIREQIDHMLKDRLTFNKEWYKMMTALGKGKKFLTDLFESSTVAYDQRDEWCTKLKSMTEKGRIDQMLQVQEMRDLQKAFDHEMKLFNFLANKGVKRINQKQEERDEDRRIEEEKKRLQNLNYHLSILNEINDYTHENSTDKIIYGFERVEQQNFSIYSLNSDFCAEIEVLTRELRKIHRDIADRRDSNESKEANEITRMSGLHQKLDAVKSRNEQLRTKMAEKEQLINMTVEKVKEMFNMLGLSLEPFQNLLGDKFPSLRQLGLTLCLISDKIKENIATVYYMERCVVKKDKGQGATSRLKKFTVNADPVMDDVPPMPIQALVPADPCPACTEARWLSRVTETDEAPLNRAGAIKALRALNSEPAYERSDRVHPLSDCRLPASRIVLAKRYM